MGVAASKDGKDFEYKGEPRIKGKEGEAGANKDGANKDGADGSGTGSDSGDGTGKDGDKSKEGEKSEDGELFGLSEGEILKINLEKWSPFLSSLIKLPFVKEYIQTLTNKDTADEVDSKLIITYDAVKKLFKPVSGLKSMARGIGVPFAGGGTGKLLGTYTDETMKGDDELKLYDYQYDKIKDSENKYIARFIDTEILTETVRPELNKLVWRRDSPMFNPARPPTSYDEVKPIVDPMIKYTGINNKLKVYPKVFNGMINSKGFKDEFSKQVTEPYHQQFLSDSSKTPKILMDEYFKKINKEPPSAKSIGTFLTTGLRKLVPQGDGSKGLAGLLFGGGVEHGYDSDSSGGEGGYGSDSSADVDPNAVDQTAGDPNEVDSTGGAILNGGLSLTDSGYIKKLETLTGEEGYKMLLKIIETDFDKECQLFLKSEKPIFNFIKKFDDDLAPLLTKKWLKKK